MEKITYQTTINLHLPEKANAAARNGLQYSGALTITMPDPVSFEAMAYEIRFIIEKLSDLTDKFTISDVVSMLIRRNPGWQITIRHPAITVDVTTGGNQNRCDVKITSEPDQLNMVNEATYKI